MSELRGTRALHRSNVDTLTSRTNIHRRTHGVKMPRWRLSGNFLSDKMRERLPCVYELLRWTDLIVVDGSSILRVSCVESAERFRTILA